MEPSPGDKTKLELELFQYLLPTIIQNFKHQLKAPIQYQANLRWKTIHFSLITTTPTLVTRWQCASTLALP